MPSPSGSFPRGRSGPPPGVSAGALPRHLSRISSASVSPAHTRPITGHNRPAWLLPECNVATPQTHCVGEGSMQEARMPADGRHSGGEADNQGVRPRPGPVVNARPRLGSELDLSTVAACRGARGYPRFLSVTPTPAPSMCRKMVSRSGFVVMASMYFGSGAGMRMLCAMTSPPGRTSGRSLFR